MKYVKNDIQRRISTLLINFTPQIVLLLTCIIPKMDTKKNCAVIASAIQQKRDLKTLLKEKDISCMFISKYEKYQFYNNYTTFDYLTIILVCIIFKINL